MLNTLEAERHTRGAVLVALLDELRAATRGLVPASTRELLTRAETIELTESEYAVLLNELRDVVGRNASRQTRSGGAPTLPGSQASGLRTPRPHPPL